MNTAFVFTSLADRAFARLCCQNAERLGIPAVSVVSVNDVPSPAAGELLVDLPAAGAGRNACIFGTTAARRMVDVYCRHADPDGLVVRLEADTLLLPPAVPWLTMATGQAHAYHVNGYPWCGCWSAPAAFMPAVLERLYTFPEVRTCAGCLIARALAAICKISRDPAGPTLMWKRGDPIPAGTHFATLRGRLPMAERIADMESLFSY